jgi:hypothetical protein
LERFQDAVSRGARHQLAQHPKLVCETISMAGCHRIASIILYRHRQAQVVKIAGRLVTFRCG